MKHIKIGVDMDDVLMEFNQAFYDFYNKKRGTAFSPKDQKTFTIRELLGISKEEEWEYINEFYDSVHHDEVLPVLGAVEAISHLQKYTLILISARPSRTMEIVKKWLTKHFPEVFSHIILTDQFQKGTDPRKGKGEQAKELKLSAFIEDSLSNAKEISSYGIPVILLTKYWNSGDTPEGVYRVTSWEEAVSTLESIIS